MLTAWEELAENPEHAIADNPKTLTRRVRWRSSSAARRLTRREATRPVPPKKVRGDGLGERPLQRPAAGCGGARAARTRGERMTARIE